MHLDADTDAVGRVADVVRQAAADVGTVGLPAAPPCEDRGAADAISALLMVCEEQLEAVAGLLRSGAALLETARHDYSRAETRVAAER
ncbi:MAG: hypothetical protein ABI807_16130 [Sporichthyaceae bacterium]